MRIHGSIGFHALQELERLLRLLGFVALVVLPENRVARSIDNYCFHGRRAYIQANQEFDCAIMAVHGLAHRLGNSNRMDLWFERCDLN